MKYALLFLFFFLYVSPGWSQSSSIDFSGYKFDNAEPVHLSGQWEFYWNELLEPGDFSGQLMPEMIHVPGSWHRTSAHPRLGCGTYRVRVKLPGTQDALTFYVPIINSASKIWINGELMFQTGLVGKSEDTYKAALKSVIVPVPERISELEIVIQVSNFTYYSSGLSSTPILGETPVVFDKLSKLNGVDNFFAGSLMAMFIYQMILFFLYRRGKPHLWLSLICLVVALRSMIVHGGSFLLPDLMPGIPFEVWKKLEFGGVYAIIALFPLYVYHLFPEVASRKLLNVFVALAFVLCFIVLITPQYQYGSLLEVCHVSLISGFAYAFYYIIKAWRRGSKDARIILFGILTAFPFILMEILKNSILFPIDIEFMYLVELGLLVFLLFQVYLLASHHAKSYKSLELLNQNLELVVEERTRQLVTANTVRERLLSVMSHDLRSPLSSLQGILNIYNSGAISKDEFNTFARQIEGDLSRTNMLVENILFWTTSQIKGVDLKMERFNLTRLIEENIHIFEIIAANKKIILQHDAPQDMEILWDKNILNLVLRNLLANAIKFSYEGGGISILVKGLPNATLIEVKDTGVGMKPQMVRTLFSHGRQSMEGTLAEKGTGMGLSLCREYLLKAGGTLTVESIEREGSTFTINIPRR